MKTQKGYLLVTAVFIILLLGFIGLAMTSMLVGSSNATNNFEFADKAFYLAASGLEVAGHDLAKNAVTCSGINGGSNYTTAPLFSGQFTETSTSSVFSTTLSSALTAAATSIPVASVSGLTSNGIVVIDNETIAYSGISSLTLTNAVRGSGGTEASTHLNGALVSQNECVLTSVAGIPTIASPIGARTLQAAVIGTGFSFQVGSTTVTPSVVIGGSLALANTSIIQNASATAVSSNFSGANIVSGGPVTLNNTAQTQVNSASGLVTSSNSSGLAGDVMANAAITSPSMFALFFSQSESAVQAAANQSYTSSNINGAVGQTIWITGAFTLSGTQTIGSPSSPVILIVNGNVALNGGNIIIYGFLYVAGGNGLTTNGTVSIIGSLAVEGAANLNGNTTVTYNAAILSQLNTLNASSNKGYNSNLNNLAETF
jgi:Tfp pilus assembly protein PilX